MKKGERTKNFILEKTAPIFNAKGYIGSSISDLTSATNLTKGAIYCNFKNKEDLALLAFQWNFKIYIKPLIVAIEKQSNGLDKIRAIIHFYRSYYDAVKEIGGCPILNIGIDAKHNNTILFQESKRISIQLISGLIQIIEEAKQDGQINPHIEADNYAKLIYMQIEGAVFLAFLHEDKSYIEITLNHIESFLLAEMKR